MEKRCDFSSFFHGGFECSTHMHRSGKRLDLVAATCHDRFALRDYQRLHDLGIRTARDGVRWHLIETSPYRYEFSSLVPMVRAARTAGTQVIWDLFHYGWPADLDLFSPEFVKRFAAFAHEVAIVVAYETEGTPYFTPVNEISFFSWAAGEAGVFYPFLTGRGVEIKHQLVRASIAAMDAVRSVLPQARFVHVEPLINIVFNPDTPFAERLAGEAHKRAQYDGWDMIAGRLCPELGGAPEYLDIVGGNYYVHNQWVHNGMFIDRGDPRYRPFSEMLRDVYERFRRPLFVSETGIEGDMRPEWLAYVASEAAVAIQRGVPVEGVCLYPIVNHPGWEDDRHCHNGLWDYCDGSGQREAYLPLADELRRQDARMSALLRPYAQVSKSVAV